MTFNPAYVNVKIYCLEKNKIKYIALSEARKLLPMVTPGAIIIYNANIKLFVCADDKIAFIKKATKLKYETQRIDLEK